MGRAYPRCPNPVVAPWCLLPVAAQGAASGDARSSGAATDRQISSDLAPDGSRRGLKEPTVRSDRSETVESSGLGLFGSRERHIRTRPVGRRCRPWRSAVQAAFAADVAAGLL